MTQLAVRIDDNLLAELDDLVKDEQFATRSEGIRAALKLLLAERRRAGDARREAEAYARFPEADDDLEGLAEAATTAVIDEEPW